MRVTDLMVGDWVSVSGKSVKITKDDLATMLIFLDDDSKIDPIPLTAKILEKNGFEYYCEDAWVLSWAHDFVLVCEVGGVRYNSRIMVKYVHQLQHLLQLCGIEKEIEL